MEVSNSDASSEVNAPVVCIHLVMDGWRFRAMLVQGYSEDVAMGMLAMLSVYPLLGILRPVFPKQCLASLVSVNWGRNRRSGAGIPPPVLKGSFLQSLQILQCLNCHPDRMSRVLSPVKPHLLKSCFLQCLKSVGESKGQIDVGRDFETTSLDSHVCLTNVVYHGMSRDWTMRLFTPNKIKKVPNTNQAFSASLSSPPCRTWRRKPPIPQLPSNFTELVFLFLIFLLWSHFIPWRCAPEFPWLCNESSVCLWYSTSCPTQSRFTQRQVQGQWPYRYIFRARVHGHRLMSSCTFQWRWFRTTVDSEASDKRRSKRRGLRSVATVSQCLTVMLTILESNGL